MYGSWNKAGYPIDVSLMFDDTKPAACKTSSATPGTTDFSSRASSGRLARKLVEAVEIGNEPGKYDDPAYRSLFENAAGGMRHGDPQAPDRNLRRLRPAERPVSQEHRHRERPGIVLRYR